MKAKLRIRLRLTGSTYEKEHGAVAVFTAIILSALLIGISAIAIDAGFLFSERRQAQNAADAAALSVAQSCAKATSASPCNDTSGNPAQWALNNAKQSMAGMTIPNGGVCGTGGLGPCATSGDTSKLPDCPTMSSPPPNYVEVHTEAINNVRAFRITPGSDNPAACARATWGPISSYTGPLPLTFSACEWQSAVGGNPLNGGGLNYAPSPPYPPNPPASMERSIVLADSSHPQNPCTTFNGHDAPGGFGWLNTGPGCTSTITLDSWRQVDTGNNVSQPCKTVIQSLVNTVVFIPVYDCMNSVGAWPADPSTQCTTGNGTHLYYHLVALAAFYLTGFQLGTINAPPANSSTVCPGGGGSGRCLFGYFVQATAPGGTIGGPGTPDLGVKTIQMIG